MKPPRTFLDLPLRKHLIMNAWNFVFRMQIIPREAVVSGIFKLSLSSSITVCPPAERPVLLTKYSQSK